MDRSSTGEAQSTSASEETPEGKDLSMEPNDTEDHKTLGTGDCDDKRDERTEKKDIDEDENISGMERDPKPFQDMQNTPERFEIIDWRRDLRRASRSMLVQIRNMTANTLFRSSYETPHGVWRCFPPEIIRPNTEVFFGTESNAIFVGTEGRVSFRVRSEYCDTLQAKVAMFQKNNPSAPLPEELRADFTFWWSIPYWGFLKYCSSSAPIPYRIDFKANLSPKKTRDHDIMFTVSDPSDAAGSISEYADLNLSAEEEMISSTLSQSISWRATCDGAGRAMIIHVANHAPSEIKRCSYSLASGRWVKLPRERLGIAKSAEFAVRGVASLGGIEGTITYQEDETGYEYLIAFTYTTYTPATVHVQHPLCRLATITTISPKSATTSEIELALKNNVPRHFYSIDDAAHPLTRPSGQSDAPIEDQPLPRRATISMRNTASSEYEEDVAAPAYFLDELDDRFSEDGLCHYSENDDERDSEEENEEACLYWK